MDIRDLMHQYRGGNRDFREIDLAGFNLYGIHFNEVNLCRANLHQIKLVGASLQQCNLSETIWMKRI